MVDLLRNSKETFVDADDFGRSFDPKRTFRLADPEAHIRRLSAFTAGVGDVASTHPVFSDKQMFISPTDPRELWNRSIYAPSNRVEFDEHDEGLIHTRGHLHEAAKASVYSPLRDPRSTIGGSGIVDAAGDAAFWHLRTTRKPYSHTIDIIPGETGLRNEHAGNTAKLIGVVQEEDLARSKAQNKEYLTGRGPNYQNTGLSTFDIYQKEDVDWQAFGDDTQSNNFREAMGDLRHRVRGVLRDPSSPRVRQIMEHALANPMPMPKMRGNNPERFSPQFLKIIQKPRPGGESWLADGDAGSPAEITRLYGHTQHTQDVIDLKTGTWAKIHPDEYFPT